MKRKKWSELEEQTLLSKYSDLLNSGTLAKLRTREKKFRPIADKVNSLHHLQDPITFPFRWSWRDVSIKVQNMRHQYLGVKQKIRISNTDFNWADGEIHWENFLKYKQVFGDIELLSDYNGVKDSNSNKFGDEGISDILGYEIDSDEEIEDEEGEEIDDLENEDELGFKKLKKGFCRGRKLRMMGAKVLELRDVIMNREEKRRDREWIKEVASLENQTEGNILIEEREKGIYRKEMELEEMRINLEKREIEKRGQFERELDVERRKRMKMQEKWEEDEMEWRERMVEMQMQHEKQMMQMHADACQNQMQVLGIMARVLCQVFGSTNDGLGPQGELGDAGKPNVITPSEFL
ncbi:hypothetical protein CASFOL_037213 [Castilleja foliolosa]|uniref:Stress response protein NST1-like n=1 Tax=Castilleja foliolosa TaxID=1961234 RepID=A0ABD3BQL5_9LAMI